VIYSLKHLTLILHGVGWSEIESQFLIAFAFEPLSFQNGARYLKSKRDLLSNNEWSVSSPSLVQFWSLCCHRWYGAPEKWTENLLNHRNSAVHCLIVLKFDMLVHYGSPEAVRWLKSKMAMTSNFKLLNRYNSAVDFWQHWSLA